MNVTVDDDTCRGHGICVAICPEVFTLTADGYAHAAAVTGIDSAQHFSVDEAAQACPEQAITVEH